MASRSSAVSTRPRRLLLMTGDGPPDWATMRFFATIAPYRTLLAWDRFVLKLVFEQCGYREAEPWEHRAAIEFVLFIENAHLRRRFVDVDLSGNRIDHPNHLNAGPEILLNLDRDALGQVGR